MIFIIVIIILFWWDFFNDILMWIVEYDILQLKDKENLIVLKEVLEEEVPTLTKEEIYNLIQNVDSEGFVNVDEKIYYKNQLLFEEVQKELDEEFFSQVKDVPIKKKI